MAYTVLQVETYITALEGALARGEKDVTFSDRRVVYNSAEDIQKRIQYFRGLLVQLLGGRSRQTLLTAVKGL